MAPPHVTSRPCPRGAVRRGGAKRCRFSRSKWRCRRSSSRMVWNSGQDMSRCWRNLSLGSKALSDSPLYWLAKKDSPLGWWVVWSPVIINQQGFWTLLIWLWVKQCHEPDPIVITIWIGAKKRSQMGCLLICFTHLGPMIYDNSVSKIQAYWPQWFEIHMFHAITMFFNGNILIFGWLIGQDLYLSAIRHDNGTTNKS